MLTIAVSLSAAGQNLLVFAVPGLDRITYESMILTQQRLQSNGVDFINHFSTAPAQGSSNAVLLSGAVPHSTGALSTNSSGYCSPGSERARAAYEGPQGLASRLAAGGYKAA